MITAISCRNPLIVLLLFLIVPGAFGQLLQVTSPPSGLSYYPLFQEGQTYTITLSADPSVSNVLVTTQPPLPAAQPTGDPLTFTLTLPTNISPGIYNISAAGGTASGDVEAAPVLIDVERADLPVSLSIQPPSVQLNGVGDQAPLSIWGTFNDGTTLFLSNSSSLNLSLGNRSVATATSQQWITGNGLPPIAPATVIAAGVGTATITVSMGQKNTLVSAILSVTVTQPPTGPAPAITSVSTTTGTPGVTSVTVNGSNFGSAQGSGYIELGNMSATSISSWTPTQIVATVPLGSMPGVVEVKQNGLASNDIPFTTVVPSITGLSTTSGVTGTPVTISGANFGATQGNGSVMFNRAAATPTNWTPGSIIAPVPAAATTGNIVVLVNGSPSNAVGFIATPTIANVQPPSGVVGAAITINGSNFGSAQSTSTLTFNGVSATPTSWGTGAIGTTVPTGASTGPVVVTVNGVASNGSAFTVTQPPSITGLSTSSGPVGSPVTISGTNFGATQGSSTVAFNGTQATNVTGWTAGAVNVTVPTGATTGSVVVTVGGVASNGVQFTVLPTPNIKSLSPTSGKVGAAVTISGTNFGSTQGSSTLTFNGTKATSFTSWSASTIKVKVPSGATTGNVVVTVNGAASNGVKFTVN